MKRKMILKFEGMQKVEDNKYIVTVATTHDIVEEIFKFKLHYSDRDDVLTVQMHDSSLAEVLATVKMANFLPAPQIELELEKLYFEYKLDSYKL